MRTVLSRRSFFQAFRWIALGFGIPLLVVSVLRGRLLIAGFLVVLAIVAHSSARLTFRGRPRAAAALVSIVTGIAVYATVWSGDGMSGSAATYLTIVPLVATVAGGSRIGAVTLGVVLMSMLALMAWDDRTAPVVAEWSQIAHLTASRGVLVALCGTLAILLVRSADALNHDLDGSRAQAQAANAAKSRLLAHCSHDLRTPIHAVQGYTALLAEDAYLAGRHEELTDLARVDTASHHLLTVIEQVLAMARLEHAPSPRTPEDVDVVALLEEFDHPCISTTIDPLPFVPRTDVVALRLLLAQLTHHLVDLSCETAVIRVGPSGERQMRISAMCPGADCDVSRDPFEPFRHGGLELALCEQLAISLAGTARADTEGVHFEIPV